MQSFVDAQPENFQGRRGFVDLGQFSKYFVKNAQKKAPFWRFFS